MRNRFISVHGAHFATKRKAASQGWVRCNGREQIRPACFALAWLAAGDALGTTLEFKAPGSFTPISDMVGGGPFGLKPGQWTDDTSMALCLAASLIECRGFDAKDQMRRYLKWRREGYMSSTGRCFDIGNTTSEALSAFERSLEVHVSHLRKKLDHAGILIRPVRGVGYLLTKESA